ncbi:Probable zinc transport system zinc-binding lipoprotein AdcA precursor [Actinomyces bovis]|uniref:Probable zinc transport system zinc-binding lipoprotein AdcA n=1 Tax=Actinomyces bovis TaxID=1658 RepID=A0ABY1VN51_9ACTO|nr:metal ABC transporter substrate-binding protein [Actinomyces bovis]SPT52483.1 Probable zinc transport system zinc-binding lipoprotein AdcA precursor [Actinomyces bovis]VEG54179.1 Probable zinc transport system zinc-binding lipoprotein AdcA precursor [Actinomyces israelii]
MNTIAFRLNRSVAVLGATALALSLAACGSSKTSGTAAKDGLSVSVSFYPVQYLVESIGGSHVKVTSVTPANTEPHDYELSPNDVANLGKADVITYVKGFQTSLDEAVEKVSGPTVVELSSNVELVHHEGIGGHHHHGKGGDEHKHEAESGQATDPHFWLDPQRMIAASKAIEVALAKADPQHASDYEANLKTLTDKLTTIDQSYTTSLGTCERKTIVTSHNAFGYLADRYGLSSTAITGVDPESEPSLADLANVKKVVQETGTTTIFTEELLNPKTAELVAQETGATTAVLSPMESKPEAGDYAAGMEANLSALKTALSCK